MTVEAAPDRAPREAAIVARRRVSRAVLRGGHDAMRLVRVRRLMARAGVGAGAAARQCAHNVISARHSTAALPVLLPCVSRQPAKETRPAHRPRPHPRAKLHAPSAGHAAEALRAGAGADAGAGARPCADADSQLRVGRGGSTLQRPGQPGAGASRL